MDSSPHLNGPVAAKTQVFRQRFLGKNLRENFLDDPPGDIGQAEVTPLKLDCQPRVIDAE